MKRPLTGYCLLLLSIVLTRPLHAQERLRHGGYDRPVLMAGALYDAFITGAVRDQIAVSLALFPSLLSFVPLLSDSKHIQQGSMADVTVGYRSDTASRRDMKWRATLLDVTFSTKEVPIDWSYRAVSSPLDGPHPYRAEYFLVGLTLLDYDRTSLADLAARWGEVRAGVGGKADASGAHIGVEWKLLGGIGYSTYRPGSAHLPLFDSAPLTGTDANARAEFAISHGNDGAFGPFLEALSLSGDVSIHHLYVDEPLTLLTFGLAINFRTITGERKEQYPPNTNRQGIEAIARFERQIVRLGDRETAVARLQLGLQYSLW